jgi:hypothetical protein
MSRYNKKIDDHISIAYGYDRQLQGYFIQIYDSRHAWSPSKTDEENAKAEDVDPSGEGEIDSYATNHLLIAKNVVGNAKIYEVLHKYGVDNDHQQAVLMDNQF